MTIRRTVEPHAANVDYTHAERALEILPEHVLPKARAAMRIIADTANHLIAACREEKVAVCNCDGLREIEALTFAMLRAKDIPQDEIHAAMDFGRRFAAAEDDPVETLRIMNAATTAWERLGRAA